MIDRQSADRRTLLKAGVWTAPAIVVATSAPAMAASNSGFVDGVLDATPYNPPEFPTLVWPSPRLTVSNHGTTPTTVSVVITQRLTSGPDMTNYDPFTDNGVFGNSGFSNYTGTSVDLIFNSTRELAPGESGIITAGAGWNYATSFDATYTVSIVVPSPAQSSAVVPDSIAYTLPAGRSTGIVEPAPMRARISSRLR